MLELLRVPVLGSAWEMPSRTPPHPVAVPPSNENAANGNAASPGAGSSSPSPSKTNGVRAFRDGMLSRKAATLVGQGLPWPEADASVHDTKSLVRNDGVPWEEKVRSHTRDLNCRRSNTCEYRHNMYLD